jgi:hypothetical protein
MAVVIDYVKCYCTVCRSYFFDRPGTAVCCKDCESKAMETNIFAKLKRVQEGRKQREAGNGKAE